MPFLIARVCSYVGKQFFACGVKQFECYMIVGP